MSPWRRARTCSRAPYSGQNDDRDELEHHGRPDAPGTDARGWLPRNNRHACRHYRVGRTLTPMHEVVHACTH